MTCQEEKGLFEDILDVHTTPGLSLNCARATIMQPPRALDKVLPENNEENHQLLMGTRRSSLGLVDMAE